MAIGILAEEVQAVFAGGRAEAVEVLHTCYELYVKWTGVAVPATFRGSTTSSSMRSNHVDEHDLVNKLTSDDAFHLFGQQSKTPPKTPEYNSHTPDLEQDQITYSSSEVHESDHDIRKEGMHGWNIKGWVALTTGKSIGYEPEIHQDKQICL